MQKIIILLMMLVIFTGITLGQVPHLINYQGVLIDSETGQPVPDETYSIVFSIYDVPAGGSAGWTETHSVETTNGFYSVQLGSNTPLTPINFMGPEKYLGIKVGGDLEMMPRRRIVSVAYAFIAEAVSGTSNRFPSDGNVGIGTTSPAEKLEVAGTIHSTSGGIKFPDGTIQITAASGGSGGGWTDGGTSVYLTTLSDSVGIGDTSPTHKLDVAGKIGINDTQMLYLPDQTDFEGTLILGNGGGSLSHSSVDDGRYNTAVGIRALNYNTTGFRNTAIGFKALYLNLTGYDNTAIGFGALSQNRTGHNNTAIGLGALYLNETGDFNTASGSSALNSNTTGNFNVGVGYGSNFYNQEGSNNTIIGYRAGMGTTLHNKSGNVFIGYQAGYNEIGDNKLYIENSDSDSPLIGGDFSTDELYLNGSVGIGTSSPGAELDVAGKIKTSELQVGTSTTAGYVLTADASGNATWQAATGGSGGWTDAGTNVYLTTLTDKVGIGDTSPTHKLDVAGKIGINDTQVLFLPDQNDFYGTLIVGDGGGSLSHLSSSDGVYNTAIGIGAFHHNTTGNRNTTVGYLALSSNTTGYINTASGYCSLASNTEGWGNTASGHNTLASNTEGWNNTAYGASSLMYNTTGCYNTANGSYALRNNTTGSRNTASGYDALFHNRTGSFNVGIGFESNYYNQEGSNNTIIGYHAGRGTSEHDKSGNVFIGYMAGYNETGSNKLYIENSASESPLIGGDFSTDELYLNASVGIGTSSPGAELDVAGKIKTSQLQVGTATTAGYVLTADASGNATWQAATGGGGGWTDGGENVYLTTSSDKVGIGDTSPTHKLDVAGKIGINDRQVVFLPDQTDFMGTLIIGNGGGSLSHLSDQDGYYNTSLGINALHANTIGNSNTAIGNAALSSNTEGWNNTASGHGALSCNTTGRYNIGIGSGALSINSTGNFNVGIGSYSNLYNQEGSYNTIIGHQAGQGSSAHNKSGNVFIGYQAGFHETGSDKLYIENSASEIPLIGGDFSINELYLNGNVGIGTSSPGAKLDVAGKIKTSGLQMGTSTTAGYVLTADASGNGTWQAATGGGGGWTDGGTIVYLTTSTDKVGIGDTSPTYKLDVAGKIGINDTQVLYLPDQTDFTGTLILGDGGGGLSHTSGTNGWYNTGIGMGALTANNTGYNNTASGYQTLNSNTVGSYNTANGGRALYSNISGNNNTASGYEALFSNSGGDENTASGYRALYSNTSGSKNTANGYEVLYHNDQGDYNTASGYFALHSNTQGYSNTASGYHTLYSNTSGHHNTASGYGALYSNTIGQSNTAIGFDALYQNTSGYYNTALGHGADVSTGNLTNATAIGFNAEVNASNKVRIGNQYVTVIEGEVAWTASSDSTKKENLVPADGEEILQKIRQFWLGSWNFKNQDAKRFRHYGPMAQEFFRAFGNDGVGTVGTDTTICGSDIDGINMIAIQALEKRTEQLRVKTQELDMLKQQMRELKALVLEQNDVLNRLRSELAELNGTGSLAAEFQSDVKEH